MSKAELEEVRAAAERSRMNVSEWVRHVLREERERQRTGRLPLARERGATYGVGRAYGAGGAHEAGEPSSIDRIRVELELKASLLDDVQARYHLPTPRAAVEFALRRVAVQPMSKEEVLEMEGSGWDGDVDEVRSGDPGALW